MNLASRAALLVVLGWAWLSPLPSAAQLPSPGSLIVTITSPTAGSTVSGTRTVSASVSVVGSLVVAGIQFRLDGVNLGVEDTTAPYSIAWNTVTASNGAHTLTAIARDTLGTSFTSDPVTVTVFNDKTPPTVSLTAPAAGTTVGGSVTVSASASDNVGVVGVQFQLDGANLGAEDTTAPYSVSWNTLTASNGAHTLTAIARDAAGNRTTAAAVTVTVFNDTTAPTVSLTAPAAGATVGGTTSVTATASDNVGVVGVQFQLDGAPLGAEDTTAPYATTWDTLTGSNGSHTLAAVARDAAGNRTTAAAVTVTVSNDTTAPTVSLTAPAAGTTVSGSITVTATAADNVGVVGVQFQLDGVPLGPEDTAAPYASLWDTTTASNGPHTLTAVARDSAGNRTTSTPVTLTVANDVPPSRGRFEETDPSITYTDGWIAGHTGRPWSGGTAALTLVAGPQATFTFSGTSVSWLGFRGPQAGIARVFLDGALLAEVDAFSPTEEIRAVVFTARNLADGPHTLTLEATGRQNPAATGALVVVDAFDVPAPVVARVQETDPAVVYTAGWTPGDASRAWSGGTAAFSLTAGAQATFTFTGTAVSWLGFRGPSGGIARVTLDGVLTEVDTFATAEAVQAELFTRRDLAPTFHTLTIEVTGLSNPAASNAVVVVDAFEVSP